MKNKTIIIDGAILPVAENEEGVTYYPIKYTFEKVLLKSVKQLHTQKEYSKYIEKHIIDYTFKGTVPQETYCINREGFIKVIDTMKLNGLDWEQKKRHNLFCDIIGANNKYINEYENVELYDEYIKDSIDLFVKDNPNIEFKTCIACGRELPMSENFFRKDTRLATNLYSSCMKCSTENIAFHHKDLYCRKIYSEIGLDAYILYKHSVVDFYIKYCHETKFKLITKDGSMELIHEILNKLYKVNEITDETLKNLNIKGIRSKVSKEKNMTNNTVKKLSNGDCKKRPWLYPNIHLGTVSLDDGIEILKTYIVENKIVIDDVLEYNNYDELFRGAKLTQFLKGKDNKSNCTSSLEFIVKFYENKYAGYQFTLKSVNYYKKKENRIFDMKYLIEKDLKIPIHKIPLYITKYVLHRDYSSLAYMLYKKNPTYNNLFEWIDECYPGEFVIHDFVINPYRSEFDSLEEAQIHDILKAELKNVIYNCRSNENYINIDGMIPDWLILNNTSCILVEYFGLHSDGDISSSHRLEKYRDNMIVKLEKYEKLKGYEKLFIYPDDLKNDFEGLRDKILKIA